jgi:hypothetical protein
MPFDPINTTEIESGKPVASTTQTKIKENFDDHESRIQTLEGGSAVYPPIVFRVNGTPEVITNVFKTTTNFSFTITGARLLIDEAGSAGTLEVNILRKRGAGSYETIFTTRPSVAYTAGDDALSSNAVLDASKVDIEAGDILRMDITSIQTDGKNFLVRIDYSRS